MDLLRHSLPHDLDAEPKIDLAPSGLRFQLRGMAEINPAP